MKALILENNPVQQEPLRKALKDSGCSVKCISNLEDALLAADEFQPDLVIADAACIANFEGGISRCTRILESAPGTRLILIIDSSDDYLLEECAELGPLAVFRRPIDIGELSQLIMSIAR